MNPVLNTLKRAIREYPHSYTGIADDIGKDPEVLRKELGTGGNHKLGVLDAIAIAAHCCEAGTEYCYDFAVHVAEECGGKFSVLDEVPQLAHSPMQRVSTLAREAGDVTATFIDALSDGVISDNELHSIEREIAEAEEALRKLRQAARAVNAAGKPKTEHMALPVRDTMRDEPVPGPEPTVVESVTTSLYSDGTRFESRMTAKGIA